ncbi:X-Pro dipeptidyl-peptidase (S15 family) protein [Aspergillus nomiae NRRL 13137]|uniref:X-Pro dipeptidyl-peptidase (S15 family) protein n=1 Tax=Aspergillus nomiae NRRL (strain ATCC 15546 / NRRL 13137 / CBS 260.88 / M93) TaxID=1509407 RepID=A0A0L1J3X7_ASPN3|nr:X-Pro dipeptidyl-peptidase (S15 family) protein [Aspergillus nomiae NRRL 13137]KNG86143.1 X-Pro dipeptidyl-peptidase (S15 family) protein [Aspergillus nomiae NRRL 13137]
MSAISIPKGPINLAGLLFKPSTPTASKTSALIVVHPGGGVKEQTAQTYAKKLANAGFTTIAYDASYQGASGGEPRFLEDPNERVSDIYAVIDYLQNLDSVDSEKIGVLGICAGGGYAAAAAKADHRLKALATVSMVNIGDSARKGWDGDEDPSKHVEALRATAAQVTAEAKGAERAAAPYVPPQPDNTTPRDMREASDYYLTPRAQHPRAQNKMLYLSFPRVLTFDAFHLADVFLKQPALLIAGDKAGSLWHTERLDKLIGGAAKKVIVPNGAHMDFYDNEAYVGPAAQNVAEFMKQHLA